MSHSRPENLQHLESVLGMTLPPRYRRYLSEAIGENDAWEITTREGDAIALFNHHDLLERNQTYDVQSVEPEYLLIGQDGDLGYFIHARESREAIYTLDLGALGSLQMACVAEDIDQLCA